MIFCLTLLVLNHHSCVSGRAMEWMNTAKEIPNIIKRLGEALKRLVKSIASRKRRDLEADMTNALSDGINGMVTKNRETHFEHISLQNYMLCGKKLHKNYCPLKN